MRGIDARFRFGGSGLGAAAQPLDFRVHQIFQRFLALALRVQILLFGFQKSAVVSVHAQIAVLVGAGQFHHRGGHVFQKVAVVADHHARKGRVLQKRFQPLDSGKVQVVGGLVEQQNIRRLHQAFDNRQALAPAAG